MKKSYLLFILMFMSGISGAYSQTIVGGHISSNTVWTISGSPYLVNLNTMVDTNVTLVIQPGVTVKFQQGKKMTVNGELATIGNSSNPITFTSQTPPDLWGGLELNNKNLNYDSATQTGYRFQYCNFEYAGGSGFTALSLPLVDHCTFRYFKAGIIFGSNGSVPVNNTFYLTNSYFYNNVSAMIVTINPSQYSSQKVVVRNNIFELNDCGPPPWGWHWVLYISQPEMYKISIIDNIFAENRGTIISFYNFNSSALSFVKRNIFCENFSNFLTIGGGKYSKNIFAHNELYDALSWNSTILDMDSNLIYSNLELEGYRLIPVANFKYNTITNNYIKVKNGLPLHVKTCFMPVWNTINNNIFNNDGPKPFYVACAGSQLNPDIDISQNWWGTTNDALIDNMIYDRLDTNECNSLLYNPKLLVPDTTAPISPPYNVIKSLVGGQVKITWDPNPETDLAGYRIHWNRKNSYTYLSNTDVSKVTSWILPGVSLSDTIVVTSYDIHRDGINDIIDGHESWYAFAIDTTSTGIVEISEKSFFDVFPNPFSDALTVKFDNDHSNNYTLVVYDMMGKEVFRKNNFNDFEIRLAGYLFSSGLYIVNVYKNGETLQSKKVLRN